MTLTRVGFVDIPANETTAIVPINVIDDTSDEPAETVIATVRADGAYAVGDRNSQQIDIADNDFPAVNIQVVAVQTTHATPLASSPASSERIFSQIAI